jgi:glycosyltransferase involved in cell wall biosynthesis
MARRHDGEGNPLMRLAIITTCYGHARFLPECLSSVAAQTAECMHVVVDDASPDESRGMITEYVWNNPTHRRAVVLDHNAGLAGAFHAGVAAAPEAEWLLKVDADDKIDPRYVEEILKAADANSERNVIFAPAKHFGARSDAFYYPRFRPDMMRRVFMIPGPAAYRRTLWDAVGGYDRTMRSAEDWDFYIRAHLAVGLVPHQLRVPGLFWYYRVHDGPRASTHGMQRLQQLRAYWDGHNAHSARLGLRSWGSWCEAQGIAA